MRRLNFKIKKWLGCVNKNSFNQLQIDLFLQFTGYTFKTLIENNCSHYGKIVDTPKMGRYIIYNESYDNINPSEVQQNIRPVNSEQAYDEAIDGFPS
jgi:hypothetical protein